MDLRPKHHVQPEEQPEEASVTGSDLLTLANTRGALNGQNAVAGNTLQLGNYLAEMLGGSGNNVADFTTGAGPEGKETDPDAPVPFSDVGSSNTEESTKEKKPEDDAAAAPEGENADGASSNAGEKGKLKKAPQQKGQGEQKQKEQAPPKQ